MQFPETTAENDAKEDDKPEQSVSVLNG